MRAFLFAVGLLMASACAAERPVLRIATDATFAPFHWLDENGAPTGFDIALARAVAEQAGFDPEVVVLAYDDLFTGLAAGTHDLVAATTGITPEREREYLFTEPYFETCQAALVRIGPNEPTRVIELQNARIGAAGDGTSSKAMHETLAAAYLRIPDGRGAQMLEAREIDAWIVDEFVAVPAARASYGRFRVLPEPVRREAYAFVLARGRPDLKARLDRSLAALDDDGRVAALRAKFGVRRDSEWPIDWRATTSGL